MSEHLRCKECGGSVVYSVAATGAACLFCGGLALSAVPAGETIPEPQAGLPFTITPDAANGEYRRWAQASWFYPRALRELGVDLAPMYLPAWRFLSDVESHWTGLRRAATRSGKEPVGGREDEPLYHMIPASGGLAPAELTALMPFDETLAVAWNPRASDTGALAGQAIPWEPPGRSERDARVAAHRAMAERQVRSISKRRSLLECKVSPVVRDRDVALFMLPIYIGAFRFRDQPWRFVVNAQTGEVVGKAPIDRVKVALLVAAGLAVLAAILAILVLRS